jgi:hypothetical protein
MYTGTDTGIRIPVLNTANTGKNQSGIQYQYSLPGKKQSGTQYQYSVPEKSRAVLNTAIFFKRYRMRYAKVVGNGEFNLGTKKNQCSVTSGFTLFSILDQRTS